jgi:hypothetical protein
MKVELPDIPPYSMPPVEKGRWLSAELNKLTSFHRENCSLYGKFLEQTRTSFENVEACPYLPVSVFKYFELRSVAAEAAQEIRSSATTSGIPSRVFVDADTAALQKITVNKILEDFLGKEPRPYLIFDDRKTAAGRGFSARGAALMALMPLASKFFFVMREEPDGSLALDQETLARAVSAARAHGGFLAYGFTYILYQAHRQLDQLGLRYSGFEPKRSFLLHSGGWKRLQAQAVSKETFNQSVSAIWGLPEQAVIDYYGMAESVGVIFPDCVAGNKHPPFFADVIIRDPATLRPVLPGQQGLIQMVSVLGRAGPNHAFITEDIGQLIAEDGCPCGRRGRAFRMLGRAAQAEVRGCGDVYAEGTS